jgi:hypothetical protein
MVIEEPVFFALTRTPSIGPSSAELTRPERAAEEAVSAQAGAARKQSGANKMTSGKK